MYILICNAGSTSLKYKLFLMPGETVLAEGKMDRVGSRHASIFSYHSEKETFKREGADIPSYREGIRLFLDVLTDAQTGVIASVADVDAIGFKTVIGKGYTGVHSIDESCMQGLEDYMNIAPVHNSAYLEAIRAFKALLPDMPMVGVFEPFFHRTMPEEACIYGIPYEWTQAHGIRRYGYHGASHRFVSETAKNYGNPKCVISCHLGGSGSICAIKGGQSQNNSFGFSLQTGIQHGSRTGDLDPFIPIYLQKCGMTLDEVWDGLVKKGGLLGISGVSGDLRDIQEAAAAGNKQAQLAINVYCHGIRSYIGSYYAQLGGLELLAFTGGIGENSAHVRRLVCEPLAHMGIVLDEGKNATCRGDEAVISSSGSRVTVAVIPANEELVLAREVSAHMAAKHG